MTKYPDINDDNFYQFINQNYDQFVIPNKQKTLKQFCFPKEFTLQIPQQFLAEYINPNTPYQRLLIYHRIGAGKTCSAITIAENYKGDMNIIIVLPASLKGNFRTELRSLCARNQYLSNKERNQLKKYHPSSKEYQKIIQKSDKRIDQYYQIYSYNRFFELIKLNELNLKNTLLIIDEVHNLISTTGSYYRLLYDTIHSAPKTLKLIIMTATPIFDKPNEIALTMNLLLDEYNQMPTGREFISTFMDIRYTKRGPIYHVKNIDLFKQYTKGYISYYRGAPPHTFPKSKLCLVKVNMSNKQYKLYQEIIAEESEKVKDKDYVNVDFPNSFFIGSRTVSNIVFPNNKRGKEGFDSLTAQDFDIPNIGEYSPKFLKIFQRIKSSTGTLFFYSGFRKYGGIETFIRLLDHHGYRNYQKHGPGPKRYAIFSGEERSELKDEIKAVFNDTKNVNGSQIKMIIGSPAVKEGVSFLRVQQVHILEPYWNFSRLDQVIGRAIRFCSHKDVPEEKQLVKVYIYLAVHPNIKVSIDQYIMKMAIQKRNVNSVFEKALKESAIDCQLFKNANVYPGEEDLICYT